MATALHWLRQRVDQDWLRGYGSDGQPDPALAVPALTETSLKIAAALEEVAAALQASAALQTPEANPQPDSLPSNRLPIILLAATDSAGFLAWFCAASSLGCPLVLGNPNWSLTQWREVAAGIAPDLIVTDLPMDVMSALGWRSQQNLSNEKYRYIQSFPQILKNCGKPLKTLWGDHGRGCEPQFKQVKSVENHWILIPTGGSTGGLRFAIHRWETLVASAIGLQESKLVTPGEAIHSCCVLPLFHVSGLMQFVRSLITQGQLITLPWQGLLAEFEPEGQAQQLGQKVINHTVVSSVSSTGSASLLAALEPILEAHPFFLSLVPTQLQRLMSRPQANAWLRRFDCIFLGGAPSWPALLEQGRKATLPLAPTYGMTETASQVVTLSPKDFLQGASGCGQVLPHAQVELDSGERAEPALNLAGAPLRIRSRSLALGYVSLVSQRAEGRSEAREADGPVAIAQVSLWPQIDGLLTDDLGYFDREACLHIVGRASDKIISGGENIFPAAVEAGILATGLVADAVVLGLPDADWGELLVAVVVPRSLPAHAVPAHAVPAHAVQSARSLLATAQALTGTAVTEVFSEEIVELLRSAIAPFLSKVQRPKQWVLVESLPRTAQGKIQRQRLRDWLQLQYPRLHQ